MTQIGIPTSRETSNPNQEMHKRREKGSGRRGNKKTKKKKHNS